MARAWLTVLVFGTVLAAPAAIGQASWHFNSPEGRGSLRWSSGCRKPDWSIYRKDASGMAEAQADYRLFLACLKGAAAADERIAVQAIDIAAREELDQSTAEGRMWGFVR